jgi:5-deoxy-glucuronate isomerase
MKRRTAQTAASRQLIPHPYGFAWSRTEITRLEGPEEDIGIAFSIHRLKAGMRWELPDRPSADGALETACLLLAGEVIFAHPEEERTARRSSLFNEGPTAMHVGGGTPAAVEARTDCELAVMQTPNSRRFAARIFDRESMVENENRGRGLLDGTAQRIVRTIFDTRNRPDSNLVLGEVVNFPGRWSSYPPHHHPQPEIYHYRFTRPQGYGHAELGESVYRVRQFDTLLIRSGLDHPQTAAPGYGMYYIWAIRHLPGNPYVVPEFTEEHRWANDPQADYWRPKSGENGAAAHEP